MHFDIIVNILNLANIKYKWTFYVYMSVPPNSFKRILWNSRIFLFILLWRISKPSSVPTGCSGPPHVYLPGIIPLAIWASLWGDFSSCQLSISILEAQHNRVSNHTLSNSVK